MTIERKKQLEALSRNIRIDIIKAGYGAGENGVHFGSTLSMAEILAVLYSDVINWDINDLENRDRMILSKGHGALALYSVLYEKGLITRDELQSFEHNGTHFAAHSPRIVEKGLEFVGGSLSLGISNAMGVALACKKKGFKNKVYVIVGDGELNEGLVWESLMFASAKQLNNIVVIVDHNHMQAYGTTEEILDTGSLQAKFESFGFEGVTVDGHDVEAIENAFSNIDANKPAVIICETVKGKGISFIENKTKWHYNPLNEKYYKKAMKELGIEL